MRRPIKEIVPAPSPTPLTETLTIKLTLSGRDLEHFNEYREAVHALNPDNWSMAIKQAYTGVDDQQGRYRPLKAKAGEALACILYEQVEEQLLARASD